MLIRISGLRGRDQVRIEVVKQIRRLLERRGVSPRAVRVAFFDDDGPRGGVAIRCALTLTPLRGPRIRVEHTAHAVSSIAIGGGVTIASTPRGPRAVGVSRHEPRDATQPGPPSWISRVAELSAVRRRAACCGSAYPPLGAGAPKGGVDRHRGGTGGEPFAPNRRDRGQAAL